MKESVNSGRNIIKKDIPMNIMKKHFPMFLPVFLLWSYAFFLSAPVALAETADSYNSIPPFIRTGADPNVMLDLSVEWPMEGAAYNDQVNTATACTGRVTDSGNSVGRCYSNSQKYLGIFDPNKAYDYDTTNGGRFIPVGSVTTPEGSATPPNYSSPGHYSGNFLNWATMTAIDEFRYALTGGRRTVDTTGETVIRRANMTLAANHSVFPYKRILNTDNVHPNTVTPFADAKIYIYNHGYQLDIGTSMAAGPGLPNRHDKAVNLNVSVQVCNQSKGLEPNCVSHSNGTIFKPEGQIQGHANRMRFAVMSYSLDSDRTRGGGVLRSTMKYVGPIDPTTGLANTKKEYDTNGISIGITNPNPEFGATNSGVINYVNKFGETTYGANSGYKSKDPAGELFYECVRYFKKLGPTPEYAGAYVDGGGTLHLALTTDELENFPAIANWDDPITSWCQPNFIVGINDANPHVDKKLPGTFFTTNPWMLQTMTDDFGEPSNPPTGLDAINVRTLTNTVGDLEGLTNNPQYVGCTASLCDNSCATPKAPPIHLGEVMGTCPSPSKQNSYYIAGLAYYAHTQDIRPDDLSAANRLPGKQSITTFMIDTQEFAANPLIGPMNMLYLAGKYGGFVESDAPDTRNLNPTNTGNQLNPNLSTEWDADGDGQPDNYVLATDPDKLVNGLNRVFNAIDSQGSSATAASVISGSQSGQGSVYQSLFFTQMEDGRNPPNKITWAGSVHALFVDEFGRMREDTNQNQILDISDRVIEFIKDQIENTVTVNKTNISVTPATTVTGLPVASILYLWSSENWLNRISNADIVTNRIYNNDTITGNKRYIFTFIDSNGNHIADSSETLPFEVPTGHPTVTELDGILHPDTIYPFIPVNFESKTLPLYVDVTGGNRDEFLQKQTQRVINFTRGLDQGTTTLTTGTGGIIPAFRSRQFDFDNNGTPETWRLGDIVNSSPTNVTRPPEAYHLLYRDASYVDFVVQYQKRRSVVYTGANDGMLHAFNGGFYEDRFDVLPPAIPNPPGSDGRRDVQYLRQPVDGTQTPITFDAAGHYIAAHPLGAELWAYIPYNLLPHLFWPTETDYGLNKHVYFVDLKPRIFDAKIFFNSSGNPIDDDHPNGWGTVLVGGMRFGGGKIEADMNRTDGNVNSPNRTMTSAYYILDITNPEIPPTVLGEITFPGLGYTTCYPTAVPMGENGGSTLPNVPGVGSTSSKNNWYLAFGSGPAEADLTATGTSSPGTGTSLTEAVSNDKAKLYVVDLIEMVQNKHLVTLAPNTAITSPVCPDCYQRFDTVAGTSPAVAEPNAFISNPISVDYQLDYKSDAVYFGTVSGNKTSGWGGELRRIVIGNDQDHANWDGDNILLGAESGFNQPITAAPTASTDKNGRRWVFFGTGRFFVSGDALDDKQQAYYGIKEPIDLGCPTCTPPVPPAVPPDTWATVSRADLLNVSNARVFEDRSVTGMGTLVNTWTDLVNEINIHDGWMLNFTRSRERNLGQAALLGSTLTFTTYIPPLDVCEFNGSSILYGLFYTTGTEYFKPMLRVWNPVTLTMEGTREISLGLGLAATPSIHVGGKDGSTIFVQSGEQIIPTDEENATSTKSGIRSWKMNEQ